MRENCANKDSELFKLNQTGILSMDFNCEVIFDSIRISTRNSHIREKIVDVDKQQIFQKISVEGIKPLASKLTQTRKLETRFVSYNDNFGSLINQTDKEIQRLKEQKDINTIEADLLTKNLIILVLIIISIIIIKAIIKKFC